MKKIFYGCNSLSSLPDISKWDISKVKDMTSILNECNSLLVIPNLSKWKKIEFHMSYSSTRNNKDKLRILGSKFVNNNKTTKCKIKYKNNEYNLVEYLEDIDINYNIEDSIDIVLTDINNINDMSYMFCDCINLKSLDIKENLNNTPNISHLLAKVEPKEPPTIIITNNGFEIREIKDKNYVYPGFNSLKSLPDLVKWDAYNIKNMDFMFYGCKSLISLPNIDEWDLSNIEHKNCMFDGCMPLSSIPDISKKNDEGIIYKKTISFNASTSIDLE